MGAVPSRVYADTSVYGGVFDAEFADPSSRFFEQVRQGRFRLVASALISTEIEPAPPAIRELLASLEAWIMTAPVDR